MVLRSTSSSTFANMDSYTMDLADRDTLRPFLQFNANPSPEPAKLHTSDSSMLDLTAPLNHATSLLRRVFTEGLLLLRLAIRLWTYLGVGWKWSIQLVRLVLYACLLLPGFTQMIAYYIISPRVRRSVVYGPKPRQRLDLYFPPDMRPHASYPVVIYVTGGAWTIGYKAWGALLARRLSEQGVLVACLDYRNFPQGDALDMLEDVNTGIAWVLRRIHRLGGDPDCVTLVGQSAGGHLAGLALLKQAEQAALGTPALGASPAWSPTCFRAFVGVSGAFDLRALAEHLHRRGLYKNLFERIMSLTTTDNGNGSNGDESSNGPTTCNGENDCVGDGCVAYGSSSMDSSSGVHRCVHNRHSSDVQNNSCNVARSGVRSSNDLQLPTADCDCDCEVDCKCTLKRCAGSSCSAPCCPSDKAPATNTDAGSSSATSNRETTSNHASNGNNHAFMPCGTAAAGSSGSNGVGTNGRTWFAGIGGVGTSHDASGCKGGARPAYEALSPLEAAQRLPPGAAELLPYTLLIHGTADKTVPAEGSARLIEALKSAGASRSRCVLVPGKTHTAFLLEDPMRGGRDLLMDTVLTAVICEPQSCPAEATRVAAHLRNEYVVCVSGVLRARKDPNPRIPTGQLELLAEEVTLLNVVSRPNRIVHRIGST